jgi:hypothetical protein
VVVLAVGILIGAVAVLALTTPPSPEPADYSFSCQPSGPPIAYLNGQPVGSHPPVGVECSTA